MHNTSRCLSLSLSEPRFFEQPPSLVLGMDKFKVSYSSYLPPVNGKLLSSNFFFRYSYTVKVTA
jgi:hypothetical protein